MKRSLFVLLLLFLCVFTARSQTYSCYRHPFDSQASLVDSFGVHIVLSTSGVNTDVIGNVLVFSTSSGRKEYSICPESIRFSGYGPIVDSTSTATVFTLLSRAAAVQTIIQGYTSCVASCETPDSAKVFQPSCVKRFGSGTLTSFVSCNGSGAATRLYGICCPNGTPSVSLLSTQPGTCDSNGMTGCCMTTP